MPCVKDSKAEEVLVGGTSLPSTSDCRLRTQKRSVNILDRSWNFQGGRIYEYVSAANPALAPVPVLSLSAASYSEGPTRVVPFDLAKELNTPYPATSPNLMVCCFSLGLSLAALGLRNMCSDVSSHLPVPPVR
jgi:hypothetical protein